MACLKALWQDEDGQGMVEYGLIVGIISVAAIVSLTAVRTKVVELFKAVAGALSSTGADTGAA